MSNELIKELITQRQKVWKEAEHLSATASAEGRLLSGEEEQRWKEMLVDMGQLKTRIDELKARDERQKALDEQRQQFEGAVHPESREDPKVSSEERQLRAWIAGVGPKNYDISFKGLSTRVDNRRGGWEVRDLIEGLDQASTTAGGYTVPISFRRQLFEHMVFNSAIRQTNVDVLNTDSGEEILIPKSLTSPGGTQVGEATAIPENDPTFGQATLQAYKYANLTQVSYELLQDSGVDLVGFLARRGGESLGNLTGQKFVLGTGTNQPQGFLPLIAVGATSGTGVAGASTYAGLVTLYYSVAQPHRSKGWWFMSDTAMAAVASIVDTTGRPIFQPSMQVGVPDSMFGRPIITDPYMPAAATAATSIAFGDFSSFTIRDVGGVRFERSDDYAFNTDLVTFKIAVRVDSDLIGGTADIKGFKGASS